VPISAIILAGGRATRMGGVDKGLIQLHQKPLIQHIIDRLQPQVDEILINANRELIQYQSLGYPVFSDESPDFIGPLAGFSLGLQNAKHQLVLTAPCDSPLFPFNLAQRLTQALEVHHADIAVPKVGADVHPVFSLCRKTVLSDLTAFLSNGGRKVNAWQKSLNYIEVDFSDQPDAFLNLNTAEEIKGVRLL